MSRIYTVPFDNLSVTNDSTQDVWQLTAAAGHAVKIHHMELYSATTTDERVRLILQRATGAGSVGTNMTEVPVDAGDSAADAAVMTLNTTPATTVTPLLAWYWSQLSPLVYLPVPEDRIVVPPSGILVLNLATAVASTRNWSGFLTWEEIS
jgi:hypothetical protein